MTQPVRILLSDTGGLAKPSGALPAQAKGGESRDFHPTAFLDADFSQLFAEIGRSVPVAEQAQDLVATCAQRQIAWLSLIETPKDSESRHARISCQRRRLCCSEEPSPQVQ